MKFIQIDKELIDYLKENADNRIPNIKYAAGQFKPLFVAFKSSDKDIFYIANLSSYKSNKPIHQKNSTSITRVMDIKNMNQCVSVINHLFVFPLERNNFFEMENSDIHRLLMKGKNSRQVVQQLHFLDKQLQFIEQNRLVIANKSKVAIDDIQKDPQHKENKFALNGYALLAKLFEYNCKMEFEIDEIEIDFINNNYQLKVYNEVKEYAEEDVLNSTSFFDAIEEFKNSYEEELERNIDYDNFNR